MVRRARGATLSSEYVMLIAGTIILIVFAVFGLYKTALIQATSSKEVLFVLHTEAWKIENGVCLNVDVGNFGTAYLNVTRLAVAWETPWGELCYAYTTPSRPIPIAPGESRRLSFAPTELSSGECTPALLKDGDVVFVMVYYSTSSGDTVTVGAPAVIGRGGGATMLEKAPPITICAVYRGQSYTVGNYHCVTIYYARREFELRDSYGNVIYGELAVLHDGDTINDVLRTKAVAVVYNPNPGHEYQFRVYDSRYHAWRLIYMQPIPGAVLDMFIFWEDLTTPTRIGDPRIDGDGDEWIRVTYLGSGVWRIAGYRAKGGYLHDFFIGSTFVFRKDHGVGWSNYVDGVWYEYVGHGLPKTVTVT